MAISKTITIVGGALGGSCDLTLAFVPPNADFNTIVPIAWKVITLSDGVSFTYAWNNVSAGSRTVIDPNTATVEADEYQPVAVGQTTDLLLDSTKRPPEYYFTAPTTYQQQTARVMNRTGKYVDIGAGFITDLDQPTEAMNPVVILRRVVDQTPGYVDYTPTLKIWATLDYEQSQLLDSSVNSVATLWEGTLTQLTGPKITITVKRVNGKLVADGPSSLEGAAVKAPFLKQLSARFGGPYTYSVDLAFATPGLVSDGVQSIVNQLFTQGYQAKLTQKGYDTEARLELTLPPNFSCNQAELDTIAAIDANPTIYGKAFIKKHSGAVLVSANNGLESWIDINPASRQWFDVNSDPGVNAAFNGTNAESFTKTDAVEANGNGTADPVAVQSKAVRRKGNTNGDASDANGSVNANDSAEAVPDEETKFRSIRRGGGARRALAA